MTERRILGKHGGEYYGSSIGAFGVVLRHLVFSREYTMVGRVNFFRGIFQSLKALYPELSRTDLFVEVPKWRYPSTSAWDVTISRCRCQRSISRL
jgi:hypothetical protein